MRNMKLFFLKSATCIVFIFIVSTNIWAQDVHFSQMEFSPLTLNPALAGANSTVNGVLNYRSQWNSVAIPYQTFAASIDGRFNENKRRKNGIMAGGLNFYNDQSGDLKITTNTMNVNLAYHLILDKSSTLGMGIYTGFGQKSISPNAGRWTSQYDGSVYNSALPSNETFSSPNFSFLDAGAGLLYSYKKDNNMKSKANKNAFNFGIAAYHLNRPANSFLNQKSDRLYVRWSIFANANINLKNTKAALLPGVYFQRQGSSMEILYGLYYKYQLNSTSIGGGSRKPTAIYFGLFNRFKDALAAKFMFEWGSYSTGLSYDINISKLNEVSRTRGGFELFLRFNLAEK